MATDQGAVFEAMIGAAAPLPRMSDRDSFYIYFAGGIQAGKLSEDRWCLEPLWLSGKANRSGPVRKQMLVDYVTALGLRPVGFHSFGWFGGEHSSHWVPMMSNSGSHESDPAQLWGNISYQVSHMRGKRAPRPLHFLQDIADFEDNRSATDRLSQSISLSLRSMGTNVQAIAEHYSERLVDGLFRGDWKGHRFATTSDQNLYAQVHSFFLHWGSARDYLAALIALRLQLDPYSVRNNSLPRLLSRMKLPETSREPLLGLLLEKGYVQAAGSKGLAISGWMEEASDLRDELVHRRPYGQRFLETSGSIEPVREDHGVFRYFRPIVRQEGTQDVFDVIIHHYRKTTELFQEAARRSGYNTEFVTLTDEDIMSFEEIPTRT